MPDLGNLSLSSSALTLMRRPAATTSPTLKPVSSSDEIVIADSAEFTALSLVPSISVKTLVNGCSGEDGRSDCNGSSVSRVLKRSRKKGSSDGKCLEDYVRDWVLEKMESGVPQSRCFLPFLVGAKKMVDCLSCHSLIYPGEEVLCSVRSCQGAYHFECVKEKLGVSNMKKFKCPQHACFMCKQKFRWRCVRCLIAFHSECAPWPDEVIPLINQPGRVVCWRHPPNWRLDKKHMVPTSDIEEVFCHLPIPYDHEEFNAELTSKSMMENKLEAPSYVHIKRNIYLVKKKRDYTEGDVGCTNCSMDKCCQDCVCRVQCISCSRACRCPESCTNRPFRREKKIKIVKTEFCGWGVEAAEPINKGEFVIEYVGEVIDDALCEQRLWDMKYRGVQNFYMCEIRKDFTIDATFKGNLSRFLNHSCDPNCLLEKWQVEGETRVGVFAARSIEVGEPLTYDYRFVQFGPEVKCYCGSLNCQGFLGTRRRMAKLNICWGAKRRRSSLPCLAIVAV